MASADDDYVLEHAESASAHEWLSSLPISTAHPVVVFRIAFICFFLGVRVERSHRVNCLHAT